MIPQLTKHDYTKLVVGQLPDDFNLWKHAPLDTLLFEWWKTGRGGSGLRLTDQGKNAFEFAEITHYDFSISNRFSNIKEWHLLLQKMTKLIKCPYYVGVADNKKDILVRIYDHRIAMMINLYGGILDFINRKILDK